MRRGFISIVILLIVIFSLAWISKTAVTSFLLSKALRVPVTIERMAYSPGHTSMDDLHIENPRGSKTVTAFFAKYIEIDATLSEVFGKIMTIDTIEIDNITIGVELYNDTGTDNNWKRILFPKGKAEKSVKNSENKPKQGKKYLIRNLVLRNITVIVTDSSGKATTYGPIDQMQFSNISDETGFPVDEIEKAVFDLILKSIFQKYNLLNLLKSVDPSKLFPNLFPFSKSK